MQLLLQRIAAPKTPRQLQHGLIVHAPMIICTVALAPQRLTQPTDGVTCKAAHANDEQPLAADAHTRNFECRRG